jgi:hypothetical protein
LIAPPARRTHHDLALLPSPAQLAQTRPVLPRAPPVVSAGRRQTAHRFALGSKSSRCAVLTKGSCIPLSAHAGCKVCAAVPPLTASAVSIFRAGMKENIAGYSAPSWLADARSILSRASSVSTARVLITANLGRESRIHHILGTDQHCFLFQ